MRQILTFYAGAAEYGVPVTSVREIAEARAIARVPSAPPWIRGVMNLRGAVVPVFDLAVKLGMEATRETRRTCLVVVEVGNEGERAPVAVMVDGVRRVSDLGDEDIHHPPAFGSDITLDFLLGLARVDGRLVILLDMARILMTGEQFDASALVPAEPVA